MADTKMSAKSPTDGAAPQAAGASGPTLGQRVAGFFRAPGSGGERKPLSTTTRFIIGSVTFVFLAEALTYLIQYANLKFKLNLNQPILGASATWFSWFFIINVVIILGLWITLNRMGFFPRDMWGPRNGTTTARGASTSGKSGGSGSASKSANMIPGIGKARTRAERRYTTTAKTTAVSNAKGRSTATTKQAAVDAPFSTEHDDVYDRVKAAQRTRKRRSLR